MPGPTIAPSVTPAERQTRAAEPVVPAVSPSVQAAATPLPEGRPAPATVSPPDTAALVLGVPAMPVPAPAVSVAPDLNAAVPGAAAPSPTPPAVTAPSGTSRQSEAQPRPAVRQTPAVVGAAAPRRAAHPAAARHETEASHDPSRGYRPGAAAQDYDPYQRPSASKSDAYGWPNPAAFDGRGDPARRGDDRASIGTYAPNSSGARSFRYGN